VLYFSSASTNLAAAPDLDGFTDVYSHSMITGVTARQTNGDGDSIPTSVSSSGLQVTVVSEATNLGPADKNGSIADLLLLNAADGTFASLATGTDPILSGAISDDGRYVSYVTAAPGQVSGDTNGVEDIFVRDRVGNRIVRVNGSDATLGMPSMSADGAVVAFGSRAPNIGSPDPNDDPAASVGDEGDVFTWTRSA
jgi:Tol biopolymer transport system component